MWEMLAIGYERDVSSEFGWARISEVNCGMAGPSPTDIYDVPEGDVLM